MISTLKHFSLWKTLSGNNTDRIEVCEPPLKAEQFRDGYRGSNIEVALPQVIQTCSAVSGSCSLPGAQQNLGPLERLKPKLPPALAYSTATSSKGLLIHTTATEPCKRIQYDKFLLCHLCDCVLFSQQRRGRLPKLHHSRNTAGTPLCRR